MWNEILQGTEKIHRSSVTNRLESILVRNVDMGAEIVGGEAQSDDQAFVSKYLLIITKDGIGELRVEG